MANTKLPGVKCECGDVPRFEGVEEDVLLYCIRCGRETNLCHTQAEAVTEWNSGKVTDPKREVEKING